MAQTDFLLRPMPDDAIGEFRPKGLESYTLRINGAYVNDLLDTGDSDLLLGELEKILRENALSYHVPNRDSKEIRFTGAPVDLALGGNVKALDLDCQRRILERMSQMLLSFDFRTIEYRDPANPRRKIEVTAQPASDLDTTF